jgi:hypothetical protein
MLETFVAAANVKAFLQTRHCPDIIKETRHLLDKCWGDENRGTLMQDIHAAELGRGQRCRTTSREHINWKKRRSLPVDIHRTLASMSSTLRAEIPNWTTPTQVFFHDRWTIGGRQFSTSRATRKDSIVFVELEVGGPLMPGMIREIFSVQCPTKEGTDEFIENAFLVVHAYKPLDKVQDPFASFPDFGASIWSINLADHPVVVPTWRRVYHAISRQWDKSSMVLKALDRVSKLNHLGQWLYLRRTSTILQGD